MNHAYLSSQIAAHVGGTLRGEEDRVITGVADLAEAGPGEVSWVSSSKYASRLERSRAGVVLVPSDFGPTPMTAILCPRVDAAVASLLRMFTRPVSRPERGIHPTAIVHSTARIGSDPAIGPYVVLDENVRVGDRCTIHAGAFIGRDTTIGEDCLIWPNAVIRDGCSIGHRVEIHPNAVIGADGLGFYFEQNHYQKIPHIGGVILEDDVEVGACTCIDRSKFGNTVIGRGTKIDNLVQIAHNVRVGAHCMFAAQAGISGSVRIGDHCVFGGKASSADNVTIGAGARFAGGLAVATKDIPPGLTVSGWPAQDHRLELRDRASLRRLPSLVKQVADLIARVQCLETATHDRS